MHSHPFIYEILIRGDVDPETGARVWKGGHYIPATLFTRDDGAPLLEVGTALPIGGATGDDLEAIKDFVGGHQAVVTEGEIDRLEALLAHRTDALAQSQAMTEQLTEKVQALEAEITLLKIVPQTA